MGVKIALMIVTGRSCVSLTGFKINSTGVGKTAAKSSNTRLQNFYESCIIVNHLIGSIEIRIGARSRQRGDKNCHCNIIFYREVRENIGGGCRQDGAGEHSNGAPRRKLRPFLLAQKSTR